MPRRILAPAAIVATLSLVAAMVALGPVASGQEATPASVSAPDTDVVAEIEVHPAHIHNGTCDELGDVVYPLNDLQAAAQVADPDATPIQTTGATPDAEAAIGPVDVVAQSGTEVDVSLDELLGGEYAINVHESPENIQTYLACGEITGSPGDGELLIELEELNNSGYVGEARLADQGDGTTIVNVSLFPSDTVGTPVGTPAG